MNIDDIFKGSQTPAKWRNLGDYLRGQRITAGHGVSISKDRSGITIAQKRKRFFQPHNDPPFTVNLKVIEGETVTYAVTVTPGYICETVRTAGENVDARNLWGFDLIDANGDPVEIPIAINEGIYIFATENEYGFIDAAIIDTFPDTTKTLNYIPDTQVGEHFWKLAALKEIEDDVILVPFLAGSHIYTESGLTCDVRIMTCDPDNDPETSGEGYEPSQLLRMSFLSGRIVSVGLPVATRPLAPIVEETNVEHCT